MGALFSNFIVIKEFEMKVLKKRKLPKKSTHKNLIQFHSHKNQKHMFCESYLESDVYLTFEFLKNIVSYTVQEFRVQFDLDGRPSTYTPDAKVILHDDYHSKGVIVEVKRTEELIKPKVWRKLRRARQEFVAEGYGFVICKDSDFQVQPRLNNLRLLYRYRDSLPEQETQNLIYDRVRGNDDVTIGELNKLVKQRGGLDTNAYAMASRGLLKLDINQVITPNSLVSLGGVK